MNPGQIKDVINNNQGIVTIVIFLIGGIGTFLGWLIKKRLKTTSLKKPSSISAGRDITAGGDIIAGTKLQTTVYKNNQKEGLKRFEKYLGGSKWREELIDGKEIWVCESNNLYQIEIGDKVRDFSEEWTKVYPGELESWLHYATLKVKGVAIKQIPFISCDGGRINVPMPEKKVKDDKRIFYWDKKSLEYKVGKIVGSFYIYENLEGVAEMSKIKIVEKDD